jgi:two-component sensor histidine kinase
VVNDLTLVHAMLGMAMRKASDPVAARLLRGSRYRVRVMAIFHSVAWRDEEGGEGGLSTETYLAEVVREAERARSMLGRVRVELETNSPPLEPTEVGAIGLVVNELVGNALDHGFPGDRSGLVRVTLASSKANDGRLMLRVSDDGVGLPPDGERTAGLGLELVRLLVEQLSGELTLTSSKTGGTDACLHFSSTRETHAWQPS